MSTGKNVFIVGPGFIGWNVLDLLINEGYTVSALVRRREHADGIKTSGATPIMGDLNDKALITNETAKNDIVFHTATADHLPSAEAVLDGVRKRAQQGLMTTYIHTSGASVHYDKTYGDVKAARVVEDVNRATMDAVADDAPHRPIDLAIVNAQKELGEKAKIAIMVPPLIYGYNPKHDRLSIQIPVLTKFAAKHGYAGYVGKGLAVTANINVMDLARAYIILLHSLDSTAPAKTLENPYYYCENPAGSEASWHEIATVVGQQMHQAGKIEDPTPREVPSSAYEELYGDFVGAIFAINVQTRGLRLRELGWKPVEKDWKSSYVQDEFPLLLKQLNEGK